MERVAIVQVSIELLRDLLFFRGPFQQNNLTKVTISKMVEIAEPWESPLNPPMEFTEIPADLKIVSVYNGGYEDTRSKVYDDIVSIVVSSKSFREVPSGQKAPLMKVLFQKHLVEEFSSAPSKVPSQV